MRVIIMETKGKEAVALGRDGRFVKIRNIGYTAGQEIMITPQMIIRDSSTRKVSATAKIAALAACFCLLFASIFSLVILNSQSYGYVSVDVNPSIEYRINRFDRVIKVRATNQDGQALLESIGIKNMEGKDIEVALSMTVNELSVQGYLDGENAGMLISSSAASDKATEALHQKLLAYTAAEEKLSDIEVIATTVTDDEIEEAEKLGTTAGKLHLIQSLGENVNLQEWIDKSVKEIYAAVQEHNSQLPTTPTDPETTDREPPEVTIEPETSVETDPETATSASDPDTTEEPSATEENPTETETETETESKTEKETETESETEAPTETETTYEEKTWPETWPESMPGEWPEEWPDPETDNNGDPVLPEPEKKPWWWWLWELLFGSK